jgi:hypothetical protein
MVDKVCGWSIPGHPVYVCILPAHGDEIPHEPKWITNKTREALVALRRRGDYVQYREPESKS